MMTDGEQAEETINATAFKARSLELIERAATGRLRRVALTKHGRPVAAIVPFEEKPVELWGALTDIMEPVENIDLTEPTDERWQVET